VTGKGIVAVADDAGIYGVCYCTVTMAGKLDEGAAYGQDNAGC
jgi:hypothetical protein